MTERKMDWWYIVLLILVSLIGTAVGLFLVGCNPRPNGLVAPNGYLVVEKIPPTTVVVWTQEEVYRLQVSPTEYEQVYVGQTGLVPAIWVE